ncbi:unnamed protein product [Linum trigynum]|uniref:Retrotransposon Copia-like N-terminal domain-containing protein n=1 Tax=Linum trigynum TaxID=586398 RepID=A0AAV2DPS6_9ROSI
MSETGSIEGSPLVTATLTTGAVIDPLSPYYLHQSDSPGQVYVAEALHDSNYGEWVADMQELLFAKNKIGFVDGTIPKPEDPAFEKQQWLRCDAMVKGWLKTTMTKEVGNSVRYATTAREIWQDLKERFGKGSAPRAYEIRRQISWLRQESLGVSAYYTKLRTLWDELLSISPLPSCSCGNCSCSISKQLRESKEKEQLYDFLMGLNDEFAAIRTHILSLQPIPPLVTAFHLALEDEHQRGITASRKSTPEAAAFQAAATVQSQIPNRESKGEQRRNGEKPKGDLL